MKAFIRTFGMAALVALAVLAAAGCGKKTPGVTDTEIKVGHINPYSGSASAYGVIGKTDAAYIKMINEQGGVNGRKINFITYDDGYSPPKTVEQARKLVEQDEVLLIFNSLGTPTNSAIHKYMNDKKVPHLLVATGATKWGDPKNFPWTMGWQPNYQTEGKIYARYLLKTKPNAKVGILYQNDDYGKDYVKGFKDGLGAQAAKMIVMEQTYETSDPTVDSQIVALKNSKADTFLNVTIPKYATQAIRKAAEIGWKPLHFLNNVAASVKAVMEPAGFKNGQGIISVAYLKDAPDPQWKNDPGMKGYLEFMKKYYPDGNPNDNNSVVGYSVTATFIQILKQCGNDLSRENVMRQAANLKNFELPLLLPGIKVNTSPTDFFPIESERLIRFKGESFELFGDLQSAEST